MKNLFLLFVCSLSALPAAAAADQPAARTTGQQQGSAGQPRERIATDVIRFQKSAPRIYDSLEAMKAAKASYIRELTAPPENVHKYRTRQSRRQMVGVYMFDMSYASVFDKKKQAMEAAEAVQQLLKALGFSDRKVSRQHQRMMKEYGSATLKTLVTNYEEVLNDSFRDITTSEEGAALVAEAAYGWVIEGLYVTSEIIAQQDYSPLMLYRLNEHAECIKPVADLLESVRNSPKQSKYRVGSEQLAVLTAISAKLRSAETIGAKEVDAVRAIVSKARADMVK